MGIINLGIHNVLRLHRETSYSISELTSLNTTRIEYDEA